MISCCRQWCRLVAFPAKVFGKLGGHSFVSAGSAYPPPIPVCPWPKATKTETRRMLLTSGPGGPQENTAGKDEGTDMPMS